MGKKKQPENAAAAAAAQTMRENREEVKRLLEGQEPTYDQLAIKEFEKYKLAGELSPEQILKARMEQVREDPRYLRSKMAALADIEKRSRVGLTPEEMSRIADLREQALADERAQQASLMQEMAGRGTLDSGAQLAAQLAGSQQGAQRRLQQARQNAADINSARQQAMGQLAQTAQGFSQADIQRQMEQAKAMDALQQFNAQQRYDTQVRNLTAKQGISSQNTAQENQRRLQNIDARQQVYGNRLGYANAIQGANQGLSQSLLGQAGYMNQTGGPSKGQAALGGAATGAMAGSAAGPWGAAIGAGVGGLAGFMSAKDGGVAKPSFYQGGYVSNKANLDEQELRRRQELGNTMEQYAALNTANQYNGSGMGDLRMQENQPDPMLEGMTPVAESSQDDKIASQVETDAAIKQEQGTNSDKTASGIAAGLGGLSSILGGSKGENTPSKHIYSASLNQKIEAPENYLGTKSSMMNRYALPAPQMKNGGFIHAEDGTVEHDGSGDVVPGKSFAGDKVDARVNSGEMVLNLEQQERLNQLLQDYKRLKTGKRVDEQVDQGDKSVNENQQDALMSVVRGESDVTDLPEESVLDQMDLDQLRKLMLMLGE